METSTGNMVCLNQRVHICIFVIISALLMVSGELTRDNGYKSEEPARKDFQTLWEVYILPRLELDLNQKLSDWQQENGDQDISISDRLSSFDYDQEQSYEEEQAQSRWKRIGVAGLENFDIMQKILHQQRNRPALPMSVSHMSNSRLQNLMRQNGRKRK